MGLRNLVDIDDLNREQAVHERLKAHLAAREIELQRCPRVSPGDDVSTIPLLGEGTSSYT